MYSIETPAFILTIVDTPGLGDTEGIKKDDENIKNIIASVQQLIEINGIVYVHKASDQRLDIYL